MFICEDCIKPTDKVKHYLRSRGPCEVCGIVKICWDIDIHSKRKEK